MQAVSELDLRTYRDRLKTIRQLEQLFIFDPIRRQHVRSTPEEFVRQLALQWLIDHYDLGRGSLQVEKQLVTGTRIRRFDIMVVRPVDSAWLLVECKSPEHTLDSKVWDQAALYNSTLQAPYIWITNGHSHRLGHWDNKLSKFNEIVYFPEKFAV